MAQIGVVLLAVLLGTVHALRKASVQEGVVEKGNATESIAAAWVAGTYGECISTCGPARFRTVECRSVDDGALVMDAAACKGPRPPSKETCICGGSEACTFGFCPFAPMVEAPESTPSVEFEKVGCFRSTGAAAGAELRDMTCFQWKEEGQCSGGLAFYAKQAPTAQECGEFCFSKGLDIFGLEGATCRCGASALNTQIWRMEVPPPGLVFAANKLRPDEACKLEVYRYAGFYDGGGIPLSLRKVQESDLEYTDSIASGRLFGEANEEDGPGAGLPPRAFLRAPPRRFPFRAKMEEAKMAKAKMAKAKMVTAKMAKAKDSESLADPSQPSWTRNCWPSQCASGNGPWPERADDVLPDRKRRDGGDYWAEYVRITYSFNSDLDQFSQQHERRYAFKLAARLVAEATCIDLVESVSYPAKDDFIRVVMNDIDSCHTDAVGGYERPATINLGSCNNRYHKGSIIHEILHVLGLDHSMKRPDAHRTYHGKGPFLNIRWDNMEAAARRNVEKLEAELAKPENRDIPRDSIKWENVGRSLGYQFLEEPTAYMGSANDGPGDPHQGYMPYDFASVMHYEQKDADGNDRFEIPQNVYDALDDVIKLNIAQRDGIGESDKTAINDMYQCKRCDRGGDSETWKDVHDYGCSSWKGEDCVSARPGAWYGRKAYTTEQLQQVQQNCQKACGLCR